MRGRPLAAPLLRAIMALSTLQKKQRGQAVDFLAPDVDRGADLGNREQCLRVSREHVHAAMRAADIRGVERAVEISGVQAEVL